MKQETVVSPGMDIPRLQRFHVRCPHYENRAICIVTVIGIEIVLVMVVAIENVLVSLMLLGALRQAFEESWTHPACNNSQVLRTEILESLSQQMV